MASVDEENDIPKVGDAVNLNVSEGPEMVVSKIETVDGIQQCTCLWFEDQRQAETLNQIWVLKQEILPIDVLNVSED